MGMGGGPTGVPVEGIPPADDPGWRLVRTVKAAPEVFGLTLFPEIISELEETDILGHIDAESWQNNLRRRVQHYGYRYDYRARQIDADMKLGPMPNWLLRVCDHIGDQVTGFRPDQVIVNEYLPGQGIGAHIDCQPCFGPVVASLSLNAGTCMTFKYSNRVVEKWLPARSLLVLTGPSRWVWSHEIKPRLSDPDRGPRGRRVSLTFRTVVTPRELGITEITP